MSNLKKQYLGDLAFYKRMLVVMLPIMIQNGITNFVSLLDNLMVGQLGTEYMSGVAIVNQVLMVYGLSIFGVVSGAAIFSTQYVGQGNNDGIRHTFRFKYIVGILLTLLWIVAFYFKGDSLISLFLSEDGVTNLPLTLSNGRSYLGIMLIGLLPFTLSQIYSSTLRECGNTFVPMVGSTVAVFSNLILNYLLIFGHFGLPCLGVQGAAIATVVSRFIELGVVASYLHVNTAKYPFIIGAYKTLYIPASLMKQITIKGLPLLINETLWSLGQATLTQCYSTQGISAVAAFNISNTVANLFYIVFISVGSAISIMVGQQLGAGNLDEAYDTNRKLTFTAVAMSACIGVIMFFLAPLFPLLYKTTPLVRETATQLLRLTSFFLPVYALYNSTYFAIRTGGKTVITFLMDSGYLLAITCSTAAILTHFTPLSIVYIFPLVQSTELIKGIIGIILVRKKMWLVNLVDELS